ncbi:DUF418 domain-containing protein [Risungbinella massiliensis]|uniref:DUF418 domain-containing protein n=1 Tax=Risungbinella massiliensis TaxID=1329796 RepID=UPI0005CC08CB|nr:DUF418 domain-containing protein [Risungbinella massiliensis]
MQKTNERIPLLDILRGFAILGTLGTNIWIFAHLGDISYLFTIDHAIWWESVQDFLRLVVLFLVNGKLLGLLTMMFGVGLELKYQQSLRKGTAWPGVYLWTSLFLLMEGLIHFTLVMEYDILMSYAVTAIIVSFIIKGGDKLIKRAMIITGTFHAVVMLYILGVSIYFGSGVMLLGDMDYTVSLYQNGTWIEQIQARLENFLPLRSEAIFVIPMNIFLFLAGIRLMRSGSFSSDETGKRIRNKMLWIGLGIGIPLNLLTFVPGGVFDFPVRYLFAPVLSIGYIALIAKMVEINERLWLWSRFEDIGKMALSCYVTQNILASFIFYGWGLGLGGKVNSLMTIGIWLLISILQMIFAMFWLRRFKFGPMEFARRYFTGMMIGKK